MKKLSKWVFFLLLSGTFIFPVKNTRAYWAWGEKKFIFWCDLSSPKNECKRWIDNNPED